MAGPRAMPGLVPITPGRSGHRREPGGLAGARRAGPCRCWSRSATATRSPAAWRPILRRHVAGAQGIEHPVIAGAGHFLQEDAGPELAEHIVRFVHGAG